MRLAADVLLEIVSIVQDGLINGTDISQRLRDLELEISHDEDKKSCLILTEEYKKRRKDAAV